MNLLSRRFPTIIGIILLTILVGVGFWYLKQSTPLVTEETVPTKVRITNVADNKFTVSWMTSLPMDGYVEYGPVGETLSLIGRDDRGESSTATITHHVTIGELQPETQYAFRIVSGTGKTRYDNNGTPYTVTTGPTIASTPVSRSIYGEVKSETATPAGAIVYLTLPGSQPVSTLVTSSNNYSFTISTIRTGNLDAYVEYDVTATVASITIESGSNVETTAVVTLANAEPVPPIALGENADYRTEVPPVAQVEPTASQEPVIVPTTEPQATTPSVFNVEPLNNGGQTALGVVLLNPAQDGETVATTQPEFRGSGPISTTLSISVHSIAPQNTSIVVGANGLWSWTPPKDLDPGEHTLTIAYIDASGIEQTLTRTFIVSPALAAEGDPAFVATPSGTTASPSPSVKASPSPSGSSLYETTPEPSPRETIPSTESGVPVTGVISPTLLTGLLGFVIMVAGALMLAL